MNRACPMMLSVASIRRNSHLVSTMWSLKLHSQITCTGLLESHQELHEEDRTSMLSKIATMKIVHKHTSNIPLPRIFDFEISTDQAFGYPYVFMEYLGGRTIADTLAIAIPNEHHPKVAKQVANVFAKL